MKTKLLFALGAGGFLLAAALLFGPEAATELFQSWTGTIGGIE